MPNGIRHSPRLYEGPAPLFGLLRASVCWLERHLGLLPGRLGRQRFVRWRILLPTLDAWLPKFLAAVLGTKLATQDEEVRIRAGLPCTPSV